MNQIDLNTKIVQLKKVLVPCDFSSPSIWALDSAINICQRSNAEIVLLHVIEQPKEVSFDVECETFEEYGPEGKLYMLELIKKSKGKMTEMLTSVKDSKVSIECQIRIGNPFHGIRAIINEYKIDLVVMGASGCSESEESWVGSNTEKVIRYAKCPVLSIPAKPKTIAFENIVYATALDDNEKPFLEFVKGIQRVFNSTLHIVRINTPGGFQSDSTIKKEMGSFVEKFKLVNCTLNVFSDFEEQAGIIHFSSSINADTIAMVTHGRTGFSQMFGRSIAENVATRSSDPVLTFVIRNDS